MDVVGCKVCQRECNNASQSLSTREVDHHKDIYLEDDFVLMIYVIVIIDDCNTSTKYNTIYGNQSLLCYVYIY